MASMVVSLIAILVSTTAQAFLSQNTANASPQQIGVNLTSYVTLAVAIIALIGTFVSKKAKSPADELAKADFAYTKIKERLEEVDKDRAYLQTVVDTLRGQLRTFDSDAGDDMKEKRELRELVEMGESRIRTLQVENEALNRRLEMIAEKVKNDEPITLADVYGNVTDIGTASIDPETEMTRTPETMQQLRSNE